MLWVSFTQAFSLPQVGRWLLAEQLGREYDEKWDQGTLIRQMVQGLTEAEPRCLLVLDNLETVLAQDSYRQFLRAWLRYWQHSKVLVTSREQPDVALNLRRRGQWLSLTGLVEPDAVKLAKEIRYDDEEIGLTGSEEELKTFVNQMGRQPLLINLVCPLLLDELGEGAAVSEVGTLGLDFFTVTGDHREVETCVGEVMAASLARLSGKLATALTQLSVLREGFTTAVAQELVPELTETELRQLARFSLLQETPPKQGKPRQFQFLPLIQTFVQQQAAATVLETAHRAALAYFQSQFAPPPWQSEEDIAAYLEAFHHAGALREWQLAHDILNADWGGEGKDKSVDACLDLQGFNQRRAALYEQVLVNSEPEQSWHRDSLNRLGNCYDSLGRYEEGDRSPPAISGNRRRNRQSARGGKFFRQSGTLLLLIRAL